jgi:hypothetical protein
MKKHLKLAFIILLTIIATFLVTGYYAAKNTRAGIIAASLDMEAFNELYRIKSRDRLEQLLIKGCNKEALEYVKMEQSLGLLHFKDDLKNGAKLEKQIEAENPSILDRANKIVDKGRYYIPTCN